LEPLQNRLEILEIQAYIEEEKLAIANNFIITKSFASSGIKKELIQYNDETIKKIIKGWCYYEGGVRELKRCFEKIGRKRANELINAYPSLS
jgi:Lon-like ATP-dependent protease